MSVGGTVEATTVNAVLRDGAHLDLLLRLQRGKPRTIEQIREIAPPGTDLGAALTALERTGLIRIERDGLHIPPPEPIIADAITSAIADTRHRIAGWRDLFASLSDAARANSLNPATPDRVSRPETPPTCETVSLQATASGVRSFWTQASDTDSDGSLLAVPNLPQLLDQHSQHSGIEPHVRLSASRLLFGARSLMDSARRSAQDKFLELLQDAGVEIRIAGAVPRWLALTPGRRGTLSVDEGDRPVTGLLTTESPVLVDALAGTFEEWWRPALPFPPTGSLVTDGLGLRSQGLSDQEAAAVLGTSARTLQREFAKFMDEIGARSRFELGVWWARNRDGDG